MSPATNFDDNGYDGAMRAAMITIKHERMTRKMYMYIIVSCEICT